MLRGFYDGMKELHKGVSDWLSGWMYAPIEGRTGGAYSEDKAKRIIDAEGLKKKLIKETNQFLNRLMQQQSSQQQQSPQQPSPQTPQQKQQSPQAPQQAGGQQQQATLSGKDIERLAETLLNATAHHLVNISETPHPRASGDKSALDSLINRLKLDTKSREEIYKVYVQLVSNYWNDPPTLAENIVNYLIQLLKEWLGGENIIDEIWKRLLNLYNILSGLSSLRITKQQQSVNIPDTITVEYVRDIVEQAMAALNQGKISEFQTAISYLNIIMGLIETRGDDRLRQRKDDIEKEIKDLVKLSMSLGGRGRITTFQLPAQPSAAPTQPPTQPPAQTPTTSAQPSATSTQPAAQTSTTPPSVSTPSEEPTVLTEYKKALENATEELQGKVDTILQSLTEAIEIYVKILNNWGNLSSLADVSALADALNNFVVALQTPPQERMQGANRMEKQIRQWVGGIRQWVEEAKQWAEGAKRWMGEAKEQWQRRIGRQLGRKVEEEISPSTQQAATAYNYQIFTELYNLKVKEIPKFVESCKKAIEEAISHLRQRIYDRENTNKKWENQIESIKTAAQNIAKVSNWAGGLSQHLIAIRDAVTRAVSPPPKNLKDYPGLSELLDDLKKLDSIVNKLKGSSSSLTSFVLYNLGGSTTTLLAYLKDNADAWEGISWGVKGTVNILKGLAEELENYATQWAAGKASGIFAQGKAEQLRKHMDDLEAAFSSLNALKLQELCDKLLKEIEQIHQFLVKFPEAQNYKNLPKVKSDLQKLKVAVENIKTKVEGAKLAEKLRSLQITQIEPSQGKEGAGEVKQLLTKAKFPDPWRKVRGGGKGGRGWQWDLNLPRPVLTILRWWDRLTLEEKNRIRRYLYDFWLSTSKEEKREALKRLIKVAQEMGIPVQGGS